MSAGIGVAPSAAPSAVQEPLCSSTNPARSSSPGLNPARCAIIRAETWCMVIVRSSRGLTDERDQPLEQRGPAVLEPGEEREVHERPHQPADEPADLDAFEARRSRGSARSSPCCRGRGRRTASPAWRRPPRRRLIVRAACMPDCMATSATPGQPVERHHVADHENLGVARQRAVRQHLDMPRAVVRAPVASRQHRAERGRLHAGRPHLRVAGYVFLRRRDPARLSHRV